MPEHFTDDGAFCGLPDRFLDKIAFEPNTGCWLWTGAISPFGYGRAWWEGRLWQAHRLIYTIVRGPIADGLEPDHLCRIRKCVNPTHIEPVTKAVNIQRGRAGAYLRERTHCLRGHPFDAANTYPRPRGGRDCRLCTRERNRLRMRRVRQKERAA